MILLERLAARSNPFHRVFFSMYIHVDSTGDTMATSVLFQTVQHSKWQPSKRWTSRRSAEIYRNRDDRRLHINFFRFHSSCCYHHYHHTPLLRLLLMLHVALPIRQNMRKLFGQTQWKVSICYFVVRNHSIRYSILCCSWMCSPPNYHVSHSTFVMSKSSGFLQQQLQVAIHSTRVDGKLLARNFLYILFKHNNVLRRIFLRRVVHFLHIELEILLYCSVDSGVLKHFQRHTFNMFSLSRSVCAAWTYYSFRCRFVLFRAFDEECAWAIERASEQTNAITSIHSHKQQKS